MKLQDWAGHLQYIRKGSGINIVNFFIYSHFSCSWNLNSWCNCYFSSVDVLLVQEFCPSCSQLSFPRLQAAFVLIPSLFLLRRSNFSSDTVFSWVKCFRSDSSAPYLPFWCVGSSLVCVSWHGFCPCSDCWFLAPWNLGLSFCFVVLVFGFLFFFL